MLKVGIIVKFLVAHSCLSLVDYIGCKIKGQLGEIGKILCYK